LLARGESQPTHDRHTDEVIAAIQKTVEAFFGGTTWRGRILETMTLPKAF